MKTLLLLFTLLCFSHTSTGDATETQEVVLKSQLGNS
jgi:hypothetical protein